MLFQRSGNTNDKRDGPHQGVQETSQPNKTRKFRVKFTLVEYLRCYRCRTGVP